MQVVKNNCHQNANFFIHEDLPYTILRFGKENITIEELIKDFSKDITINKKEIFLSERAFDLKLKGIELYSSQVKAFKNFGQDLIKDIDEFGRARCPQFPLSQKPCEVIYEIK